MKKKPVVRPAHKKKLVVRPHLVDGVLTVNQLPAVVVCKSDNGQPLAAFAFRSRPKTALHGGIPLSAGDHHQAFAFPMIEPGTYDLMICDGKPPHAGLQLVRLRVKKPRARGRAVALAVGPVQITTPQTGATGVPRLVAVAGNSTVDNPANVRTEIRCNNNHVFPPGGNAPPDFAFGQMWLVNIQVTEDPLHNPFRVLAHDSLGNSDEVTNITIAGAMPGPAPAPLPTRSRQSRPGRTTRKRNKVRT